jgi:hypothetical protein
MTRSTPPTARTLATVTTDLCLVNFSVPAGANRRLQPLGHLTADLQVFLTQRFTRKRSIAKA